MAYLDRDKLASLDAQAFRAAHPYPWAVIDELLTPGAYRRLVAALPQAEHFNPSFGRQRRHGQTSHDRYVLEYRKGTPLPAPWAELMEELQGDEYRGFVRRMLGIDRFLLNFHWHYTPRGCSVSPHCDAEWKLGSHIFYLNTPSDWAPEWGGETLVLDDDGHFAHDSAPAFEDFPRAHGSGPIGNRSLLFARTERSWHGVRPLRCPEGALRKVFIIEFRAHRPAVWVRQALGF